jgi:hypothetical protein
MTEDEKVAAARDILGELASIDAAIDRFATKFGEDDPQIVDARLEVRRLRLQTVWTIESLRRTSTSVIH